MTDTSQDPRDTHYLKMVRIIKGPHRGKVGKVCGYADAGYKLDIQVDGKYIYAADRQRMHPIHWVELIE